MTSQLLRVPLGCEKKRSGQQSKTFLSQAGAAIAGSLAQQRRRLTPTKSQPHGTLATPPLQLQPFQP